MAIMMITHDLGVVAELANDVIVMYGGRIVEQAKVDDLFAKPEMPYTWGLLGSLPRLDSDRRAPRADSRPAAVAPHPAARVPVQPALRVRDGHLPGKLPDLDLSPAGDDHRFRCHLDDETRARIWTVKKAGMVARSGSAA